MPIHKCLRPPHHDLRGFCNFLRQRLGGTGRTVTLFMPVRIIRDMQYFSALKAGEKRVAVAREYLNGLTGGKAMPAMALGPSDSNDWKPVGEENLYAFVNESQGFVLTDTSGYILVLVDGRGISKAIVQGVTPEQAESLERRLREDGISKFEGRVVLPA